MNYRYCVAIRTLGLSGDKFVKELNSIFKQTILPEKVIIYIAEGYTKPSIQIGFEQYISVKKGMVAQRALEYNEINTDFVLLLDDDVYLPDNCVETLFTQLENSNGDCIAADVFHPQKSTFKQMLYDYLASLSFPRKDDDWAFKVLNNASFSYNGNPHNGVYLSQSAAGPISLWKLSALKGIHYQDELWLDNMGFSFGDDQLMFQKLYKNGYRLLVSYNSGAVHMDAKSASSKFQESEGHLYIRAKGMYMLWRRSCYDLSNNTVLDKIIIFSSYFLKQIHLLIIHIGYSLLRRNIRIIGEFIKGNIDGYKEARKTFCNIPNFIVFDDNSNSKHSNS